MLTFELAVQERLLGVLKPRIPLIRVGVEVEALIDARDVVGEMAVHPGELDLVTRAGLVRQIHEAAQRHGLIGHRTAVVDLRVGDPRRREDALDGVRTEALIGRIAERSDQPGALTLTEVEVAAEGEAEAAVEGDFLCRRAPVTTEALADVLKRFTGEIGSRDLDVPRDG